MKDTAHRLFLENYTFSYLVRKSKTMGMIYAILRNPLFWVGTAIFGILILLYNRMVRLRVKTDEALSGIEVQLKRRYDLIPRLKQIIQDSASQEQQLLDRVGKLNLPTKPIATGDIGTRASNESKLGQQVQSLILDMEKDNNVRSHQHFQKLAQNLSDVENDLQMARRYYNALVRDYNIQLETFPNGILAGLLNLQKKEFFLMDDHEYEDQDNY